VKRPLYDDQGFSDAKLIERSYLEPKDRDDREALAAAVTACFYDALMTPQRPISGV
jgi:hypothetical protein